MITAENILLLGSILIATSILISKSGYRFGIPTLLLFLLVGMAFGSDGLGISFDNASDAIAKLKIGMFNESAFNAAVAKAGRVLYCGGFNSNIEGEGFDRPFELPQEQRSMISRLTEAHPHVTVVLNAGGGVDFNGWSEGVEAVLYA